MFSRHLPVRTYRVFNCILSNHPLYGLVLPSLGQYFLHFQTTTASVIGNSYGPLQPCAAGSQRKHIHSTADGATGPPDKFVVFAATLQFVLDEFTSVSSTRYLWGYHSYATLSGDYSYTRWRSDFLLRAIQKLNYSFVAAGAPWCACTLPGAPTSCLRCTPSVRTGASWATPGRATTWRAKAHRSKSHTCSEV